MELDGTRHCRRREWADQRWLAQALYVWFWLEHRIDLRERLSESF